MFANSHFLKVYNNYLLVRRYRKQQQHDHNETSQNHLICLMQEELRKNNFMDFDKLKMAFREFDQEGSCSINKPDARRILLSSLGLTRSKTMINSFRHLLDLYLDKKEVTALIYLFYKFFHCFCFRVIFNMNL